MITEQWVREHTTEQSFVGGQNYYHNGAVIDTSRRGDTLEGYCEGPEISPYHIRVVLDSTGKLLTDLDALDHVDPEVTPQRLRDQGLYRLVFEKLISMGRIEEAVAIIEEHLFTPVELVQSFSALAAAGQLDMAIGLARKRLDANLIFILPIGCWTPTARKEIGKPVLSYCSGECRPYLQCGTMPN